MTPSEPLPVAVARVVGAYRERLEGEGAPVLRGLYLVGSVALDDFRPGASDVDFVALTDAPLTEAGCGALTRVHVALTEEGGPCFDGFYLSADALRTPPAEYRIAPFSLEGRFRTGEVCREINPVVWRCLARHGRAILGPPPHDLGIADDEALFRSYQLGNLRSYWLGWITQCETALAAKGEGEACNAEALAWGVLGVGRIACGLETGRVVSKAEAGRIALASREVCWHGVIREALAAHAGTVTRVPVDTVRDGLAYMRLVAAEATDDPTETRRA